MLAESAAFPDDLQELDAFATTAHDALNLPLFGKVAPNANSDAPRLCIRLLSEHKGKRAGRDTFVFSGWRGILFARSGWHETYPRCSCANCARGIGHLVPEDSDCTSEVKSQSSAGRNDILRRPIQFSPETCEIGACRWRSQLDGQAASAREEPNHGLPSSARSSVIDQHHLVLTVMSARAIITARS